MIFFGEAELVWYINVEGTERACQLSSRSLTRASIRDLYKISKLDCESRFCLRAIPTTTGLLEPKLPFPPSSEHHIVVAI